MRGWLEAEMCLVPMKTVWREVAVTAMVCITLILPTQHLVAERAQDAASPSAATHESQHQPIAVTEADISRAYMNCLIEVDKTMAVLAGHANLKAVRAESQSQRAFCENRKRDCLGHQNSSECRTFIAEFRQSELVEGTAVKSK